MEASNTMTKGECVGIVFYRDRWVGAFFEYWLRVSNWIKYLPWCFI